MKTSPYKRDATHMHPITAATRHRPFMFLKLLYLRTAFPKKNCNHPLQVLLSYSLSCPVSLSSFLLLLTLVIVELSLHVGAGKKHIIAIIQVLSLTIFSVQQMILAASAIDNMDLADDRRISSNSCTFPSSLHPYRLLRSSVRSRGANPDLG